MKCVLNIQYSLFNIHDSPGPVAEWLGKALQKLLHRFESGRDLKHYLRHCKKGFDRFNCNDVFI